MESDDLILLAESCSRLRASIGRMLLTSEADGGDVERAREEYRLALRTLLQRARDADCGVYLEVAGQVGV